MEHLVIIDIQVASYCAKSTTRVLAQVLDTKVGSMKSCIYQILCPFFESVWPTSSTLPIRLKYIAWLVMTSVLIKLVVA